MVSKYYNLNIIAGLLLIALTSVITGILLNKTGITYASFGLVILVIIEIIILATRLNRLNRKIAKFFNAVHNEDSSISIPANTNNRIIKELYQNLNRVVQIFSKLKMQNELREQLFMAMIEHSSTGFISIDDYGDFEIMNEMARQILGVNYTSNMSRLKTDIPVLYNTIESLLPGEVKSCEINLENFSTILQVSASQLRFQNKNLTLVSLLDIKKEIELREMESWQKLIRIMNHEIMNSIAPITSVSKSLSKIFMEENEPIDCEKLDDKKIQDTISGLEVIETMSSGLSHFVENYRQLSQIPKPEIKEIPLEKWSVYLRTVGNEIAREHSAELSVDIDSACCAIMGDERLLNQVLINLIKNAAEAPANSHTKKIALKFNLTEKNKTRIVVQNNGKPISDDALDKIFIPFFTTKNKGAGIGLFLSRQIVSLHGGTISVTSNKKTGTIFTIEI